MTDGQIELRRQWRLYWKAWREGNGSSFPRELADLRCGAKTRAGTPCKRRDLYASGRCRLHGGLSTGPKGRPHEGYGKVKSEE